MLLSSAIVFGLSFATVLTLVVTPAMLMVFTRDKHKKVQRGLLGRLFSMFRRKVPETGTAPVAVGQLAEALPKAAE